MLDSKYTDDDAECNNEKRQCRATLATNTVSLLMK